MIDSIPWAELPAMSGSRLYLDYIAGRAPATGYFPGGPTDFDAALSRRRHFPYPRVALANLLAEYNASIGADPAAIAAAHSLADGGTFCVIGGQQAEFLGGPVFTAYKIVSTIRLARHLSATLGVPVVPMFWLASDDHDFGEIGHVQFLQSDGEVGRVRFTWEGQGRAIADMPISDTVLAARDTYMAQIAAMPHAAAVAATYAPEPGDDYCRWHARVWSRLFSPEGLVVVEPRALRPLCGGFYAAALRSSADIAERLHHTADDLAADGYAALLTSEQAGRLFTFAEDGRRVRLEGSQASPEDAEAHPERYSADAALRPILADSLLPVLANVLGAGEVAYHAMLKPLYALFGVPQPVLFPRKHYTVVSAAQSQALRRYGVAAPDVLAERLDVDAVFSRLAPAGERALFQCAREQVEAALLPLQPYLSDVDPGLSRTWEGTLSNAQRALDKLEERALKARLAQLGFSRMELQTLRNALLPRGRLQERVLPLPHFLARHGTRFLDVLYTAGALDEFAHHVITLSDDTVSVPVGTSVPPLEDIDAQR
ncbi:MAG: bacillithiol biosynthesis cysteine-adding enzyme BshC [Anaerolineae bacterium]